VYSGEGINFEDILKGMTIEQSPAEDALATYRAGAFRLYGGVGDEEFILPPGRQECVRLPAGAAELARSCDSFRTIPQHAEAYCSHFGLAMAEFSRIQHTLRRLAEEGVLVSPCQVTRAIHARIIGRQEPPPISRISVIAADRPALLKSCLETHIANFDTPDSLSVGVFDDSHDASTTAENEAIATSIADETGVAIGFAGRSERLRFVAALVEHGVPREIAAFSLRGIAGEACTTGANRNAALLESIGQRSLMVDDDTACRMAAHPRRETAVRFGGHENSADLWFYRDRAEALANANWTTESLGEQHNLLLGRTLAEVWGVNPAIDRSCTHTIAEAMSHVGRIRVTACGAVGDSGCHSPIPLLWTAVSQLRERADEEPCSYEIALGSRERISVDRQPTINHRSGFKAMSIGIDSRGLVPPFLPVYRNQDGVFSVLLDAVCPSAFVGRLPIAILHQAPAERRYADVDGYRPLRMSDFLIALIRTWNTPDGLTDTERLISLGSWLQRLAKLPAGSFVSHARHATRLRFAGLLQTINSRLPDIPESIPDWSRRLAGCAAAFGTMIEAGDSWIPEEWRRHPSSEMVGELQRIVGLTGSLLMWWPRIIEVATELRRNGIQITRQAQSNAAAVRYSVAAGMVTRSETPRGYYERS